MALNPQSEKEKWEMNNKDKERLMAEFVNDTGGPSNLTANDFQNVVVRKVKTEFPQGEGKGALCVEFDVSHHAIGKMGKEKQIILGQLAKVCGVEGYSENEIC